MGKTSSQLSYSVGAFYTTEFINQTTMDHNNLLL